MSDVAGLITAIAALVGALSTPALVVWLVIRASKRERKHAARRGVDRTVEVVAGGQPAVLETLLAETLDPEGHDD